MKLKPRTPENFYATLKAAGMPEVPGEFSVVPQHQVIPSAILAEISDFIHCFDRVTAREAWQAAALREAPAIVQLRPCRQLSQKSTQIRATAARKVLASLS